MALSWDPSLATGLPEIDGQHQELFARIERLLSAVQRGQSREEVVRVLDYLARYVVEHFSAEERLMEEREYPEREAHRAEHRRFEMDLAALRGELEREGASALLVIRVNARVTLWLRDHIYRTDKALVAYLKDRYLTYSRS
jgi:hemerythrin